MSKISVKTTSDQIHRWIFQALNSSNDKSLSLKEIKRWLEQKQSELSKSSAFKITMKRALDNKYLVKLATGNYRINWRKKTMKGKAAYKVNRIRQKKELRQSQSKSSERKKATPLARSTTSRDKKITKRDDDTESKTREGGKKFFSLSRSTTSRQNQIIEKKDAKVKTSENECEVTERKSEKIPSLLSQERKILSYLS